MKTNQEIKELWELGIQKGIQDERERILEEIAKLEEQSHRTKTPIYQETMFAKLRHILGQSQ
jgi:hypothetical protein